MLGHKEGRHMFWDNTSAVIFTLWVESVLALCKPWAAFGERLKLGQGLDPACTSGKYHGVVQIPQVCRTPLGILGSLASF